MTTPLATLVVAASLCAVPAVCSAQGEVTGDGGGASEAAAGRPPSPASGAASGDSADAGEVKAYDTEGGRVVFSLDERDATLVSATPGPGWSMQVWKTETWIRVDFAAGADRVSVFCTWHDSAPRVDVQNF